MNNHQSLIKECNDISNELIIEKCNSRIDQIKYLECEIANDMALIVDRLNELTESKLFESIKKLGYSICLKRESTHQGYITYSKPINGFQKGYDGYNSIWFKRIWLKK